MPRTDDPLATAQADARSRIEVDGRGAPAAVRRLLETLSQRLFDTDFDAAEIAADPDTQREFRFTFGVSPKGYRDGLLLDAARWLICKTEMPVTEIAAGLGFAEPEAFSRWFKYRTGLSPMKLREQHRPPAEERPAKASPSPSKDHGFPVSFPEWCRVMLGVASREKALMVLRYLYENYPEAFDGEPPPTE